MPIAVSHHMLKSLVKGVEKMSKSIPDSAIFMEDSIKEVERKIKNAYCPEKEVDDNPLFDYIKYLIFPKFGNFELKRLDKHGGDKVYNNYEEICKDNKDGNLHPKDLKENVARLINDMIEPVRKHFENDPEAKNILSLVNSFKVTR